MMVHDHYITRLATYVRIEATAIQLLTLLNPLKLSLPASNRKRFCKQQQQYNIHYSTIYITVQAAAIQDGKINTRSY